MNFRSFLFIDPWNTCFFKVVAKLRFLPALNDRFAPPAIDELGFHQLAYVLLRIEQFNPHIVNYYNFESFVIIIYIYIFLNF